MPTTETVAVVDIGGTKIAAALVDRDGGVVRRSEAPTPARAGAGAVLSTASALVASLRDDAHRLLALGVGSAGVIDPVGGHVLGATDALPGWAGTDLRGELAARTGLATTVVNDVHAHALGESRYGAARGRRTALFVAVGTGVGGAFVLPGGTLVGANAAAGHVGHVPSAHARDLPCSCGATGHLEAIASGPALVREHTRRTGVEVADLEAVVAAASAGDAEAASVIRLGGLAVGATIGGLVNVLDPDVVVVGGGVVNAGDPWWAALVEGSAAELLPSLRDVEIVGSGLGGDAALLGAASLAWELVGEEA